MKFIRNFSRSLWALPLCLFALSPAALAADFFSDVGAFHPNVQAIQEFKDGGTVVGYKDGSFGEDREITRAEFLKILMEVAHENDEETWHPNGDDCFADADGHWAEDYICEAEREKYIDGYPNGDFKPDASINFAEASKIVMNVLELTGVGGHFFEWFEESVKSLSFMGAVPNAIDSFDAPITRSDMAEMTWRIKNNRTYKVSNTYDNIKNGIALAEHGTEFQTFDSCKEIEHYYEDNVEMNQFYSRSWGREVMLMDDMEFVSEEADFAMEISESEVAALDSGSDAVESKAAGDGSDFSDTNVQVEGVDEADIVKTDGEYIYFLRSSAISSVKIVDARDPANLEEVEEIFFNEKDFYPQEMYVDGDRLVVLGSQWQQFPYDVLRMNEGSGADLAESMIYPYRTQSSMQVFIYDISDRDDAELMREFAVEGDYSSSRKVDDTLYFVMSHYSSKNDLLPVLKVAEEEEIFVDCSDIRYLPRQGNAANLLMVGAVDVTDDDAEIKKEVIMGASGSVYSSRNNLYVAEPKYAMWSWYEDSGSEEETYVHKFALDGSDLEYEGVGAVPGTVLNQFSMDENGDYFRIATTVGQSWVGDGTRNNVYVLDSDLEVVGDLEGLAPGESIFSARFMGDKLYLVTFEQIDPLFVIDLSDPRDPSVLGELKIPGFSNYLHPLDENTIIGIGRETSLQVDEHWGNEFLSIEGMKLAMFDVRDLSNPELLHKEIIGDRGTTSDLLFDHKALLFDADKGLMAFPVKVAELSEEDKADEDLPRWQNGDFVFQGAYVYDISREDGFDLRGSISHYDEGEIEAMDYYWSGDEDIRRILYIGDFFYTISNSFVKSNEMESLEEEDVLVLPFG